MILVEKHQITKNSPFFNDCDLLSYISKNLYNSCLYYIRQHYFNNNNNLLKPKIVNGQQMNYWVFDKSELYHELKNKPEYQTHLHQEYNGYKCNTKILSNTVIQVERIFRGHVNAVKEYHKTPSKFKGKPKLPRYKDKNGRNEVTVPKQALSFVKKKGYVHISMTNIYIKLINATEKTVKEVKIIPRADYYEILVSYEVIESSLKSQQMTKIAGIDLGVKNLVSLSSNDTSVKPFLINGRPLKSINRYYNKKAAKMRSLLPRGIYWSNALSRLTRKRNNKIHTEMHKISSYIVNELIKNDIDTLIVGNNVGIKQGINMGSVNNQNYVSIPYYKLRKMLEYKCKRVGIRYIETEESYTSKCSFLDMEGMKEQVIYKGTRKHRGLFIDSCGNKINADLNGSLNIIRKVAGDYCFVYQNNIDLVEGYAVSPVKVNIK